MDKLVAFDIEIANPIPDGVDDWKSVRPLGVSCAVIAAMDYSETGIHHDFTETYFAKGKMNQAEVKEYVTRLMNLHQQGSTIVGWNSTSFDWDVLAEESGMYDECVELCYNHVDLMLVVVAIRGHYLGLDKAAKGHGIAGKLKSVALNNGTLIHSMSGKLAPEMWQAGEYNAVLEYLKDDGRVTLELARKVAETGKIQWISGSGKWNEFDASLLTVRECLQFPPVDTSWMTNPPSLTKMTEWMTKNQPTGAEEIPW